MDPALGFVGRAFVAPLLSPKDAAAPPLAEAAAAGLLPSYDECRQFYAELRSRAQG
jgi:dTDP-4-dehydrorhamnose 3,5-epimerase